MSGPGSLLLVEDDPDIAEAVAHVLASDGWRVTWVEDGLRALEHLEATEELPSLVVLDLMMPRLDGRGFRARQRAHPRFGHVPVLILSSDPDARAAADELGAAGCLAKPSSPGDLLATVRRLAGNRQRQTG